VISDEVTINQITHSGYRSWSCIRHVRSALSRSEPRSFPNGIAQFVLKIECTPEVRYAYYHNRQQRQRNSKFGDLGTLCLLAVSPEVSDPIHQLLLRHALLLPAY